MKFIALFFIALLITINSWADGSARIEFKNQLHDKETPIKIIIKDCRYISPGGKGRCLDLNVTKQNLLSGSTSIISFRAPNVNSKFYGMIVFKYKDKNCAFYMPYFSFFCPSGSNLEIDHNYNPHTSRHSLVLTLKSIK